MIDNDTTARAEAFARQALGDKRVSQDTWRAATLVAEYAIRAAGKCVPLQAISGLLARMLSDHGYALVERAQLDELVQAAKAHKMFDSYPTDSVTLIRFKLALHKMRVITLTTSAVEKTLGHEIKTLDEIKD